MNSKSSSPDKNIPVPHHLEANYSGDYVKLENRHLSLVLFRRNSHLMRTERQPGGTPYQNGGWAWGEIYGPLDAAGERQYLGIMEHLAEVDLVAMRHPLRLEGEHCEIKREGNTQRIEIELVTMLPEEPCMVWDNINPVSGRAILTLGDNDRYVSIQLEILPRTSVTYRYLRGPWLRIGAYEENCERTDAMFPGLEWLIDKEWSSGTDFHTLDNALRVTPHPYKVHIPMMTVSRDGFAVGLSWPMVQNNMDFYKGMRELQPIFASPNFVDRRQEHVMGVMLPTAVSGLRENELQANSPRFLRNFKMTAEIFVVPGKSLDAVVAWSQRNGMSDPGQPRWDWPEALEKIAHAFNTNLWKEGVGWTYGELPILMWTVFRGFPRPNQRRPHMYLRFIDWYIQNGKDKKLAAELAAKAAWCRKQGDFRENPPRQKGKIKGTYEMFRWYSEEELRLQADALLTAQQPDGSYRIDLESLYKTQNSLQHLQMAARWKPMAMQGDTAINLCVTPAIYLLLMGDHLGEPKYLEAARKALEFSMRWERPEGGDWWECPLHAPNLLTAGWAMLAYELAARVFDDKRYHDRARHFLRSLLPFTYLAEPAKQKLLYETKPLYGTTGWHYIAWTDRCVQWQIILLIDISAQLGVDWTKMDPEVDWATYRRGAVTAGLRWMVDSKNPEWMLKCEELVPDVLSGRLDMTFSDVHDPVNDMFSGIGLAINPAYMAASIFEHLLPAKSL